MASLKFGDLAVDVDDFDLRVEYWKIRKGESTLPGHEHAGIREMWANTNVLVMQYDCTQHELIGTDKVDKKGRFLVSQKTVFSALDANGDATSEAAEKLFLEYVAASGYGDGPKFDAKLDDRFGSYTRAVPYAKFLKVYGSEISFDVFAFVKFVVLRVTPSVPMSKGTAFLAIPYEIFFHSEPTFNCNTGTEIPPKSGFGELLDHIALDPKDPDLRKILLKRLKQDRKSLAKIVKEAKENAKRSKAQAKKEPDSKFYKAMHKINKDYYDDRARELKAMDKRLKGYKDD